MVALQVQIPLTPGRRPQVIRSLQRILGQTRVLAGCLRCQLCTDLENDARLVLLEEWADLQSLRAHVRDDSFRVILSALDLASDEPEVRIDTIADTRGMGFIRSCRQSDGQ